jgi:hypothetical protein
VTWEITGAALVDPISVGIMVLSLFLLIAFDPNTSWLILGGALIGLMKGIVN